MPVFDLRYREHWNWTHFDCDPYKWNSANPCARLSPEIHSWLSKFKVRHTLLTHGACITGIHISDKQQATLFKLTWM